MVTSACKVYNQDGLEPLSRFSLLMTDPRYPQYLYHHKSHH